MGRSFFAALVTSLAAQSIGQVPPIDSLAGRRLSGPEIVNPPRDEHAGHIRGNVVLARPATARPVEARLLNVRTKAGMRNFECGAAGVKALK